MFGVAAFSTCRGKLDFGACVVGDRYEICVVVGNLDERY